MIRVYTVSGRCAMPLPPTIAPFASGSALFIKTPHAARGSVGVFTYDLLQNGTRRCGEKLAVMFSVPYNFSLHSNWYAVGVFDESRECDYDLYCEMYYEKDRTFLRCRASNIGLTFKADHITIEAAMSDSYEPVMKVRVSKR